MWLELSQTRPFFFRRIDNAKFLPLLTPKTKPIWRKCIARPGWAKLHQPYPGKLGLNFYEQCSIDVCWCETVGGSRGGGVCKVHFCFHLVAKNHILSNNEYSPSLPREFSQRARVAKVGDSRLPVRNYWAGSGRGSQRT